MGVIDNDRTKENISETSKLLAMVTSVLDSSQPEKTLLAAISSYQSSADGSQKKVAWEAVNSYENSAQKASW